MGIIIGGPCFKGILYGVFCMVQGFWGADRELKAHTKPFQTLSTFETRDVARC